MRLPAVRIGGGVMSDRTDWGLVLDRAADIVYEYDTLVTLRQLFYRLVAEALLVNTISSYKGLSARTAEARRQGIFPELTDRTRTIHRYRTFPDPDNAIEWLQAIYRRDRTEGQDVSVFLGVEKAGIVAQLESWFGDLGIPVLALGGYASQSFVDQVRRDVDRQARPAVLLYAGDFDPSGEDIDRDFVERTDCWSKVVRVALDADQVDAYRLPPAPGKSTDSRAGQFVARHGRLVQVELDALPPSTLRDLYQGALDDWWDDETYHRSLAQEDDDLRRLGEA
jgi:hypothetical protein